jgi:uncharacterized membrane protein
VLALADGVFAIIITLLVLEVQVPELTPGHTLNQALGELRPSLVAFVVSFILAGMYWVGHRDLFALIRRTDRGLVWLNILYLLPLCLLPFAAGLLGRYDQEPVALRIYGLLLVAIAAMRVVIWLYATNRPQLLWQRLDARQRRTGLVLGLFPGLAYLLAFLVARSAPGVSLLIYAACRCCTSSASRSSAAAGSGTWSMRTSPDRRGRPLPASSFMHPAELGGGPCLAAVANRTGRS